MKSYVLSNWPRLLVAVVICAAAAAGVFPDPMSIGAAMAAPFLVGDTSVAELKTLIETQGRAWEEFKKTNDEIIKAKADGKAVGDLEVKLKNIEKKLDETSELKKAVDAALAAMQRPSVGDGDEQKAFAAEVKQFNLLRRADVKMGSQITADIDAEHYKHYKSGFFKLVRTGNLDSLSADERKAMIAGGDADGGYLLPAATQGKMVTKLFEQSIVRQLATIQPISGSVLEGIIDNNEADAGWVAETGTRSETNTPQVGKYRIEAHEMYASPKVSQTLIDDAAIDVEAWLSGKVADKFARVEGLAFWRGTGVGQPRGMATYTLAATGDDTRAWGQIEKVKSGANGAFHTDKFDAVHNLMGTLKDHFLANATFVMRRSVRTAARKIKEATTDRYMWEPGLQAGQPERLMGYPVRVDEYMPALATGSASLAFGDFRQAYTIVDRIGMRTLRDPFTAKPYIVFYSTKRTGGGVVNFEAIKFITFES